MSRQHANPLLISDGLTRELAPLPLGAGPDQISEAALQQMIHDHPACLPISEIDPLYVDPIPLCMELVTRAGPIDNLLITASGLPVLVECKLWRNPEARRDVVGQILDYAKELSRWSASDIQREVAQRTGRIGNPIIDLLREHGRQIDEVAFNDALTHNLRRGRFLLLIVGDGIREGVEAIADFLQAHAGLHFSIGLVELPVWTLPGGERLILPRVLARTELIRRTVIEVPERMMVVASPADAESDAIDDDDDPTSRSNFWRSFIRGLRFDDPDQPLPRVGRQGYVSVMMPVPGGNVWLTVYRAEIRWEVGVYLSYARDSIGDRVVARVLEDWPTIKKDLGGGVSLTIDKNNRRLVSDDHRTGAWTDPEQMAAALSWLRRRTNDFVNALRPRIKAALADLDQG